MFRVICAFFPDSCSSSTSALRWTTYGEDPCVCPATYGGQRCDVHMPLLSTTLSSSRSNACSASANGVYVVAGGADASGTYSSDIFVYRVSSSGSLTILSSLSLPHAVIACSAVSSSYQILIAGGALDANMVNGATDVTVLDTISLSVSAWASLIVGRYYAVAVYCNGYFVLYGGYSNAAGEVLQWDTYYSVAGGSGGVQHQTGIASARSAAGGVCLNNKVVIAGGGDVASSSLLSRSAEVFDPVTGLVTPDSSTALSEARAGLAAVPVMNRYAIFAGGYNVDGSSSAAVDIYDSYTQQWSICPALQWARSSMIAAQLSSSRVAFIQGLQQHVAISGVDVYSLDLDDRMTFLHDVVQPDLVTASYASQLLVPQVVYGFTFLAGGSDTSQICSIELGLLVFVSSSVAALWRCCFLFFVCVVSLIFIVFFVFVFVFCLSLHL